MNECQVDTIDTEIISESFAHSSFIAVTKHTFDVQLYVKRNNFKAKIMNHKMFILHYTRNRQTKTNKMMTLKEVSTIKCNCH